MSIKVSSIQQVAKLSNSRIDADESTERFEAPSKKLGSRVTKRQAGIIAQVVTKAQVEKLMADKTALEQYSETGDKSAITAEQNEVLTALVKAGREAALQAEGVKGESQARRIWPRKVAAMVLALAENPSDPAPVEQTTETEQTVTA